MSEEGLIVRTGIIIAAPPTVWSPFQSGGNKAVRREQSVEFVFTYHHLGKKLAWLIVFSSWTDGLSNLDWCYI